MTIERRIILKDIYYYIGIELKYNKKGNLCKKDNSYFDLGDLSCLIKNIELTYLSNRDYCNWSYMNDVLYLYDRMPFLSYIKDVDYDKNNGQIIEITIILKKEIDDFIKNHKIEMGKFDGKNSVAPMLFSTK